MSFIFAQWYFISFPKILDIIVVTEKKPFLLSLAERESIAHTMQSVLDEATDPWVEIL